MHNPLVPDHDFTIPDLAPGDDTARTVIRNPAPTLPPGESQEFVAPRLADGSFVAARGQVVGGKYVLGEKMAQGTFGVVFAARDRHLDREVAIKLLNPAHAMNHDIVQRFVQEARAAARITHPGIVTMFDCGMIDGGAYIAMELLHGESLTARLQRCRRLAPAVAIEIAHQLACALAAAHDARVLHRDLKPENIYLVPDPAVASGERVKVLDFGLAKLDNGTTRIDSVFGTPRYMSPEQCRSAKQIDHRTDIYALGCILFELVTGRTPYEGSLRELVEGHKRAPIPRASAFSLEVTPALDDLIHQMLQKDPAHRPQSMAAVQRMLKSVELEHVLGASPIALPRAVSHLEPTLPPAKSRGRTPLVVAALAFLVAGALTAFVARGPAAANAAPPASSSR